MLTAAPPPAEDVAPSPAAAAPSPARARALTPRALGVGALLVAALALCAPINDQVVGNTLFFCHYLPPCVVATALLFAFALNPLLGARRFARGEVAVILGMILALGGVATDGFAYLWTQVVAGPAKLLPAHAELAPLAPKGGDIVLPRGLFIGVPAHGALPEDAEQRVVVDGYHDGLPRAGRVDHRARVRWRDAAGEHDALALSGSARDGREVGSYLDLDAGVGAAMRGHRAGDTVAIPGAVATVIAVADPGVPWHAWLPVALRWLPLVVGAFAAYLALAGVVRRQWIDNERLPFPTAEFLATLTDEPEGGRRLPALLRDRGFAIGFGVAALVLGSQGLEAWHALPVSIPTTLDLRKAFDSEFWHGMESFGAVVKPHVYLGIVGLAFVLPLDLLLSLWACFIATNLLYAFARAHGVALDHHHVAGAGVGAFAGECLLILWIGRKHYASVLLAALPGRRAGPYAIDADYARVLLLACATMTGALVAFGAHVHHAILAVLVMLGFLLVLARLVAEAGIPFVQVPIGCFLTRVLATILGTGVSAAAFAPLMLLGPALMTDTRENLLPYAVEAEYLGARAGVPRRRFSLTLLATATIGAAACVAIMLAIYYRGEHIADAWPLQSLAQDEMLPVAEYAAGTAKGAGDAWGLYALGAALVAMTGACRALFAWWPLHPLGLVVVPSPATSYAWASFFVAWLAKWLAMRYGGVQAYKRLKPVAVGLIAGESAMTVLFLAIEVVAKACGATLPHAPHFLPG